MATGGMSFKGGNYQMNVSLDASKALDVAKELDAVLEKVGTTLRNISRGRDVSELWNQQAASIDNVAQALERYSKNVNSVGNAEDLIKSLNAFKAWNPEIKDVDIFSQLRDGAEELVSTAGKLAANLDSAFDVQSLRNAFDAFEALKSAGVDVGEIVTKLGQGDVSNLTNQIEQLERQLSIAQMRARDLQEQVNSYESGAAFEEMREKLSMLEEATERAQYEFRDFLSSIGFAGHEIDPSNNWGQFHDWFEAIANGSLTAKEAIAQFKRENAGMFDTVSQSDLSMILNRMEQFGSAIEEMRNSLTQLGASGSLSDMERTLEHSSETAKQQNAELAQVGANSAVLETLIQELTRLAEANVQSGEAAQTANSSLVQLLGSLERLSATDPEALENLAVALRSISKMDGISVGKSSMQNLISALEALSRLTNTSSLTALSTVDLRNFNDLHISKASLANMAEFLPTISGANIGALQQLANIDWSRLSALNISKASVSGLSQLLGSIGANGLNLAGAKIGLDETGLSSLSKSIEDAIQRASQNIKLTIDNVELSATAQKKIADAAQKAASGSTGGGPSGGSPGGGGPGGGGGRNKESDELLNLIKLYEQYYSLRAQEATAINRNVDYNADLFNSRAEALWEEIAAIEEANPALAELAGSHERVTAAVRASQAAINNADAAEATQEAKNEAKAVDDLVKKYEQYYAFKSKQITATHKADIENADAYRSRADVIWEEIQAIEAENPKLAELAGAHDKVTAAVQRYQDVANKGQIASDNNMTKRAEAEEAALQKVATIYNKLVAQMAGKSDMLMFGGNKDSIAQYNAAMEVLRQRFDDVKSAVGSARDAAVTAFNQQVEAVRNLETELNNAAKSATSEQAVLDKVTETYNKMVASSAGKSDALMFGGNQESIARYNAAMEVLRQRFNDVTSAVGGEREVAVNAFNQQVESVRNLTTELNNMARSTKAAESDGAALSQRYATFRNQLQAFKTANPKAYGLNRAEIDSWFAAIDSGADRSSESLRAMKLRFTEMNGEMRRAGTSGKTFFQQLQAGWQKFGGWSLVTKSFTRVVSTFKQMVTAVKEVDSAMTELRKVTDLTASGYEKFYNNATKMAVDVGAKLSDTINATAD